MKALVIFNPVAGGGRARRAQPIVAGYLRKHGCAAEFAESRSTEDVRRRAAEAATAGYTHIAALGGDGTFHHTVAGAFGSPVVYAFLPAGNGNDIARGLGIPEDPVDAARIFLRGAPRPVDVLRARLDNGRTDIFLGAGGMGLDAEAARLVHGRFNRLPGAVRYIVSALYALATFDPLKISIELDGQRIEETPPSLFAVVANAPDYGAGLRIAPAARMDDGLLDVTLVGALGWTRIVEAIPIILRTGDLRWAEVLRFRGRRIRLTAELPALFHGNGEVLGETPVEIEVLPAAVRIIAPKS